MGASCEPGAAGQVAPKPPKFGLGDLVLTPMAIFGPCKITAIVRGPVCSKGCCEGFLYVMDGTDKHPKILAAERTLELWGP